MIDTQQFADEVSFEFYLQDSKTLKWQAIATNRTLAEVVQKVKIFYHNKEQGLDKWSDVRVVRTTKEVLCTNLVLASQR
ncbi:hypothetical protein KNT87_gp204 [Erwinia phage Cronus]|uniref:Uncharacterized protein n=1 Tax=Erwinia phage Cronus TaxID=2163633 RepID=A0A2S1GLV1_9CAUD|nr:hypothetical protein KNT87_gp204 [Erwinia phage Cronus]AWD90365.1 hypothetical protein [Erwinia phage Cronus]